MKIKRAPLLGAMICILLTISGCTTDTKTDTKIHSSIESIETSTVEESEASQIIVEEEIPSAIEEVTEPIEEAEEPTPINNYISLGNFRISAYCHCSACCGKSDGITATGTRVQANRTIAVDPRVIPLGSSVMIDGRVYVAEDTGGLITGNKIDMYFSTHQEALNWGVQYKQVSLVTTV